MNRLLKYFLKVRSQFTPLFIIRLLVNEFFVINVPHLLAARRRRHGVRSQSFTLTNRIIFFEGIGDQSEIMVRILVLKRKEVHIIKFRFINEVTYWCKGYLPVKSNIPCK